MLRVVHFEVSTDEFERLIELLREGTACIVSRNTWRRQIVREPSVLPGITFGKGTQHRPVQ